MPSRTQPALRASSTWTRTLILAVVFALIAAACGGGGDDEADAPIDEASDTTTSAAADSDGDGAAPSTDTGASTADDPGISPPTTRGTVPNLVVEPLDGVGAIGVLSGEPAYSGVVGQLDAERNIVAASALPPDNVPAGIAPLTGLPLDDPAIASRPAIVAKIDNTDRGRPQEALSQADIVFETEIEGGFTRLAAVWHSNTPEVLGPVRSGRTTDIAVFSSFNTPIFVWSGANRVHSALIRRFDMVNLGAATRNEYFRAADRPGTYDLMTDPTVLWDIAAADAAGGTPPVHFEYRDDTVGLPPSATPVSDVRIDYASVGIDWAWDAAAGGFVRTQAGTPHVDADEVQIIATNVVVAEVDRRSTGMVDTAGSPVTEQVFVGAGRGIVFTDGHAIEVLWTKPSLSSVPTWTTPDGVPVALLPGQTWIELTPPGATTYG
ncbi:MAG: DUF3048 domain-containing protein [Actinomycetota bacterium]